VIARTSAFQFKSVSIDIREVGQRLAANLVMKEAFEMPATS